MASDIFGTGHSQSSGITHSFEHDEIEFIRVTSQK